MLSLPCNRYEKLAFSSAKHYLAELFFAQSFFALSFLQVMRASEDLPAFGLGFRVALSMH